MYRNPCRWEGTMEAAQRISPVDFGPFQTLWLGHLIYSINKLIKMKRRLDACNSFRYLCMHEKGSNAVFSFSLIIPITTDFFAK